MSASSPPNDSKPALDVADGDDETTARVLDAALAELTEFGIRRTTVDTVASRAGLARMTVYRRFAGKDALVQAVVMREVRRFLASLARSLRDSSTVAEGLENGFVAAMLGFSRHPLCQRVLATEAEAVLPYLTRTAAPSITLVMTFIREQIALASDSDRYAPEALEAACEAVTRLAQSFALTPRRDTPPTEDEVRTIARRMILPLLTPA